MSDQSEDFIPQFNEDKEPEEESNTWRWLAQVTNQPDDDDDWPGPNAIEETAEYRYFNPEIDRTQVSESTPPHPFTRPTDTTPLPIPMVLGVPLQPGTAQEADISAVTGAAQAAQTDDSSQTAVQSRPGVPAKRHRVPILVLVLTAACLCVLAVGSLGVWGYLTNSLPPEIASLIAMTPGPLPELSPGGVVRTVTPSPTMTVAPEEPAKATGTATPAVFVTVLPSRTPTLPVTIIPTRTRTKTSTPRPIIEPPVPTPIATVAASTLAPSITREGQNIVQAGALMVYVPGGPFTMGADNAGSESPAHAVTLNPFYIDKYEVTNRLWAACVAAGACSLPGSTDDYTGRPYFGAEATNDYPVVYISWFNADAYCRWRGARLPTEAEWEMAARWNPATGAVTVYPWGNDWDRSRLNYCDASCALVDVTFADPNFNDGWPQMSPVIQFPGDASPVGAVDMAGNVAEWVFDWYSSAFYGVSPAENPVGPSTGVARVIRGGGWSLDRNWARSTARSHFGPLTQVSGIGFRCAIPASAVP